MSCGHIILWETDRGFPSLTLTVSAGARIPPQVSWLQLHAFPPLHHCAPGLSQGSESWASWKQKFTKIQNRSASSDAPRFWCLSVPNIYWTGTRSLVHSLNHISRIKLGPANIPCICPSSSAVLGEIIILYAVHLYLPLFSKLILSVQPRGRVSGGRGQEREGKLVSS